jgi:hypothetical protein
MMFSLAWRWSSLTHAFALSSDDYSVLAHGGTCVGQLVDAYSLCDVVDYHGTIGVPVIHGSKRLVSLLASSIPDLKFDGSGLVEGNGLGEKSGADC